MLDQDEHAERAQQREVAVREVDDAHHPEQSDSPQANSAYSPPSRIPWTTALTQVIAIAAWPAAEVGRDDLLARDLAGAPSSTIRPSSMQTTGRPRERSLQVLLDRTIVAFDSSRVVSDA